MTNEEQTLLMIKGAISQLPKAQQDKIQECAANILALLKEYGEAGPAALGLVGAMLAKDL